MIQMMVTIHYCRLLDHIAADTVANMHVRHKVSAAAVGEIVKPWRTILNSGEWRVVGGGCCRHRDSCCIMVTSRFLRTTAVNRQIVRLIGSLAALPQLGSPPQDLFFCGSYILSPLELSSRSLLLSSQDVYFLSILHGIIGETIAWVQFRSIGGDTVSAGCWQYLFTGRHWVEVNA